MKALVKLSAINITLLVLLPCKLLYPQFEFRLNSELGYFNSSGTELVRYNDLLVRLDGQVKYKIEEKNKSASVLIKARPEFFRLNNSLTGIKLKAQANYYVHEDILSWGLNISRQKNIYGGNDFNLQYDILVLIAEVSWYLFKSFPLTTNFGYGSQTVDEIYEQNHDMFFFDLKVYKTLGENLRFGIGFYSEKFSIDNDVQGLVQRENINRGLRYGPQINLHFLKTILVNADYRFLFHNSEFTGHPSFEQWIRIVAGIIFLPNWSAFILADYYSRDFDTKNLPPEQIALTYSPLNLENRIYLKIGYEVNKNIELYIKSGYFKENLYRNKYLFAGWNSLAGIEVNL